MKTIILFDQDTQHYRQSIYRNFKDEFLKYGYNLIIVYDKKINTINFDTDFFIGIDYTFNNFKKIVKFYNCKLIIQFVWLRYKFLIPFMIWSKIKAVKIILWSHGINLQNKNQPIKNQLYYLRQRLANALIIYTPEQKKYIKASKKKVFIANNTLDFNSLPKINSTKKELKEQFKLNNQMILLTIGRMNTNNRKVDHLIKLSKIVEKNYKIIIIGPGISPDESKEIERLPNITYLGPIYDQKLVSTYYKMSDLFIMPGAIGLAINQAFYYGLPVIIENVNQGPEAYYLYDNKNGMYYSKDDVVDLNNKIMSICGDDVLHNKFSKRAKDTIKNEASLETMISGFTNAIKYIEKNSV
jgi:glycosyltransferase involved in cell wall biosynthesis